MSRPFATVSFQASRKTAQQQPRDVLIRQREYKHDTAVITLELESKAQSKYAHGAPVTIAWGWQPDDVEFFHGYVHHTVQKQSDRSARMLQVYCVGASYRMKQVRLRSFTDKLAHQVAARIAKEHHFSLTAALHLQRHATLAQHGRSDWDFLVWLAKRVGYTFYAKKTDLVFLPRNITKVTRNLPTFVFSQGYSRQRNSVYKIAHKIGEAVPGTENRARVAGNVSNAGAILSRIVTGPKTASTGTKKVTKPVFGRISHARPALTPLESKYMLEAEANLHRFNTTADVELSGSTKVHQGSTIRLAGTDDDSDGLWYVTSVDHHITVRDYRMKAQVARDRLGDVGAPVTTSVSGNPVVLTDCDVSVDSTATPAPEPVYNPVDDCVPIEETVRLDDVALPFVLNPILKRRVDKLARSKARQRAAAQSRKKTTTKTTKAVTKGKATVKGKQAPAAAKPPKLTGWKAKTHRVRMVR